MLNELSHKIMEVHVSPKNTIPAFQPRSKRAKEQLSEAIVLESERQQYHLREIASKEIHGSCVFTDNIYLALPEILHLIRADKQNQMPQSHSIHNGMRTNLDGSKTSIQYI